MCIYQARSVFVTVVKSKRTLITLATHATLFKGAFFTVTVVSANVVDAVFVFGAFMHAHGALVQVDTCFGSIGWWEVAAHTDAFEITSACCDTCLRCTAIVFTTKTWVR